MGTVPALEDRVLVLRDRVDVLMKTFNPNQVRGKDGKWIVSGGGVAVYHGTSKLAIKRILREGLKPQGGKLGANAGLALFTNTDHLKADLGKVFLTTDLETAFGFADDAAGLASEIVSAKQDVDIDSVVYKVKIPATAYKQNTQRDESTGEGALSYTGEIKPEWIVGTVSARPVKGSDGKYRLKETVTPKDKVLQQLYREKHQRRVSKAVDFVMTYLVVPKDIQKDFDPNEARDPQGKWTAGGSGRTVLEHVRNAKGWLSTTRINEAVNLTYSKMKPLAKQALGTAVAAAVGYASKSGSSPDFDAIQISVETLADQAGVRFEEAQAHVVSVLQKLKDVRMKNLGKAAKDPVIAQLDKAIAGVKKLKPRKASVNKLEDRVLVLRDKVDTVKKAVKKTWCPFCKKNHVGGSTCMGHHP